MTTHTIQTHTGDVIATGILNQSVITVEGNWYFAPEAVDMTYLRVTERTYTCPYKGVCYWLDLDAPGAQVQNVGWVYQQPKPSFELIKDKIGFVPRSTACTQALTY
ncbi:MAG: DUF427 domain-containing protein [Chloroflexota bacterium]|nr:DUF427 domain-containing protein [Chloroflexota bacterium]